MISAPFRIVLTPTLKPALKLSLATIGWACKATMLSLYTTDDRTIRPNRDRTEFLCEQLAGYLSMKQGNMSGQDKKTSISLIKKITFDTTLGFRGLGVHF